MNSEENPFADRINRSIDVLWPNISASLDKIETIDPSVALNVLGKLVEHACQATNTAVIVAARNAITSMPQSWLRKNLVGVARDRLNLEDDWEYRRLLELLSPALPDLMGQFIEDGRSSKNPDVKEAAEDYASGRYNNPHS